MREVAEISISSVTDNPVYLPPDSEHPLGRVYSTGGYHNAQACPAIDAVNARYADLCTLCDHHTHRLHDPEVSGLPESLAMPGSGSPYGTGLLAFIGIGYPEEARHAAARTFLPASEGGGFAGQNDVPSPTMLAYRQAPQREPLPGQRARDPLRRRVPGAARHRAAPASRARAPGGSGEEHVPPVVDHALRLRHVGPPRGARRRFLRRPRCTAPRGCPVPPLRKGKGTVTTAPNILFIMMDQLAPQVLAPYGGTVCRTPNIERLADEGVVFENAYCNYPICAPARFSFMSGRLPSRIGSFDNACELPSEVPTFAHYLRTMGYHTCLSGKMHFVGADQLHGFEDRVTTDVYPSDFSWTSDWSLGPTHWEPWYHSMRAVLGAGPWRRSVNTNYDEEVSGRGLPLAPRPRRPRRRPTLLPRDLLHQSARPLSRPAAPLRPLPGRRDRRPEGRRDPLRRTRCAQPPAPLPHRPAHGRDRPADVRRARRAYYAVMSWLDERVGRVLDTLEAIGEKERTIVVLSADHGDMLGERGLWFKMCFFEWSARVPLIVHAPGTYRPRRVKENVSLIDLFPTFLEWAGDGAMPELVGPHRRRGPRRPRGAEAPRAGPTPSSASTAAKARSRRS